MREDGSVTAEGGDQYSERDGAEDSINLMKDHGPDADLFVMDDAAFDVERRNGGWAWRLVDQDREPLALAAEERTNREQAIQDKDAFQDLAADAMELVVEAYGIELVEVDDAWQWRLRDSDHTELAESVHAYGSKGVAENQVYDLLDRFQDASTLEVGVPTYDVYEKNDVWQWRMVDETGSTVVTGAYDETDADSASAAAKKMRAEAGDAPIVEMQNLEFETYRDGEGWHWRLVTPDREVRAHSTDTYETEADASAVVDRVLDEAPEADLIEFEQAAFQVYEAEGGAWRWRLMDEDRTVIATGERKHDTRDEAEKDLESVREEITAASVLEIDSAAFEFHQTDDGWRWRLVDEGGNEMAQSLQTFESRSAAQEQLTTVKDLGPDAWISAAE